MIYVIISASIIFIVSILLICFLSQNNKIKEFKYKVDLSFNEITLLLYNKTEILDRLINIIERELKKENKTFKSFKSIKSNKLSEFELDKLLTETSTLIFTMFDDNQSLSKIKSFDGLINDLRDIDKKLVSLRTYYNKYSSIYNNIISKFQYKITVLINKYKNSLYFEGKEINETID